MAYIAEIIFFASIAYIAYLVIKKLPITDMSVTEKIERKARMIEYDVLHALDKKVLFFFGKMLRRMRLYILKVDNVVVHRLESVKQKTQYRQEGSQNILREISEKSEQRNQDEKKEEGDET